MHSDIRAAACISAVFSICMLMQSIFCAITDFGRTGLIDTLYFESSKRNNKRNCGSVEREPRSIKPIATTDVRKDCS